MSNRQEKGKPVTEERRYDINTIKLGVKRFAKAVQSHWHVENKLHWTLDVPFNEVQNRKRKDYSAVNFTLNLKAVINLRRGRKSKGESIRVLRRRAGQNTAIIRESRLWPIRFPFALKVTCFSIAIALAEKQSAALISQGMARAIDNRMKRHSEL